MNAVRFLSKLHELFSTNKLVIQLVILVQAVHQVLFLHGHFVIYKNNIVTMVLRQLQQQQSKKQLLVEKVVLAYDVAVTVICHLERLNSYKINIIHRKGLLTVRKGSIIEMISWKFTINVRIFFDFKIDYVVFLFVFSSTKFSWTWTRSSTIHRRNSTITFISISSNDDARWSTEWHKTDARLQQTTTTNSQ